MAIEKTALILVDLQKESGTSDVVGMDHILQETRSLIETCREKNIPIIYTRHINRADGTGLANKEPVNDEGAPLYYHSEMESIEIAEMIKPEEGDIIIDKYRYSGFHESSLDLMLKGLGVNSVIIGGVLTDVCVIATAMDAFYRDYQVNLVKDICGTTSEGAHMAAVLMMANWIYDIEIFDAKEMVKKLSGDRFRAWKTEEPEQLQFSPENLREKYAKL